MSLPGVQLGQHSELPPKPQCHHQAGVLLPWWGYPLIWQRFAAPLPSCKDSVPLLMVNSIFSTYLV